MSQSTRKTEMLLRNNRGLEVHAPTGRRCAVVVAQIVSQLRNGQLTKFTAQDLAGLDGSFVSLPGVLMTMTGGQWAVPRSEGSSR